MEPEYVVNHDLSFAEAVAVIDHPEFGTFKVEADEKKLPAGLRKSILECWNDAPTRPQDVGPVTG